MNIKQNSGGTPPKHYAERVARRTHQNGSMFSLNFARLCDAKRFGQTASRTCALRLKCNISPKSAEAGIPVLKTPSRTNINPKHMENVMKTERAPTPLSRLPQISEGERCFTKHQSVNKHCLTPPGEAAWRTPQGSRWPLQDGLDH